MYLETPPKLIPTEIFSAMPDEFRRNVGTEWGDANRPGAADRLLHRRAVIRCRRQSLRRRYPVRAHLSDLAGQEMVAGDEYDGWPNGLKISRDGRILVADYRHGIMELDARAGRMMPILRSRNSESFRGCNDLHIASNGDIYFTDQGQTGLHDPSGRVYRLKNDGRLDCLIDTGISPNGLVLDPGEAVLFVAMTRDNAVWRAPFMKDGSVSKVGRFCSTFGASGPDGLTMDSAGRLFVAHASLGHVFVFAPNGEWIARIKSCAGNSCTNVAIGGKNRDRLYITESATGTVLVADISVLDS